MTHIQQRGDTASNWTAQNPVLMDREIGWETNTRKAKFGDGVTAWNSLPYFIQPAAPADSPAFTGNPTAPTAPPGDNDTTLATTEFVTRALLPKSPSASPVFTGDPKAPTPALGDNDTSIATTAFVKGQQYAPLASPALTGNPTAPTPATADNDTSVATTAFVKAALLAAHPVGDIKMCATNVNPGTYLGGTWVAWGSGRVPVGVDAAQTEFDAPEETGGAKTVTLTEAQMPSHTHEVPIRFTPRAYTWTITPGGTGGFLSNDGAPGNDTAIVTGAGGNAPHTNLQPYITCYMFKRTA